MKDVKMIFNIAVSFCEMNGYTMQRLDIQKYHVGSITGYAGYMYYDDKCIVIRNDGSFVPEDPEKMIG